MVPLCPGRAACQAPKHPGERSSRLLRRVRAAGGRQLGGVGMTRDEIVEAAHRWIDAWNARDVESVLGHFEESARFTSPKALATTGCAIVEGRARCAPTGELACGESVRCDSRSIACCGTRSSGRRRFSTSRRSTISGCARVRCSGWAKGGGRWKRRSHVRSARISVSLLVPPAMAESRLRGRRRLRLRPV
jgi:hypothetical protein